MSRGQKILSFICVIITVLFIISIIFNSVVVFLFGLVVAGIIISILCMLAVLFITFGE